MKPKEKKAFEPSGLVPRSIVRTFERFRQQLLPGSETAAIREYRISRYQVLVSARCLFTLLTIPIVANWLVSNWLLSPLIEHFWNTQQNEIFLNSYQEERAFNELEFFSEKLFFESLLNNTVFYESNIQNFSVNNNHTINTNLYDSNVFPLPSAKINSYTILPINSKDRFLSFPCSYPFYRQEEQEVSATESEDCHQRFVFEGKHAYPFRGFFGRHGSFGRQIFDIGALPSSICFASLPSERTEGKQHKQIYRSKISFACLPFQEYATDVVINSLKIKEQVQDKILKLAVYYNQQTILSITNIIGDLVSLITLGCLFIWMKPEITILKSFLIEAIYSLSDTTKSFLLILLTDLLVGFHSPRGWETALELLLKHFGLPENQDFVFLFVATFPVLLDTVFKYWIFRHLNKISPSTVATYHSMIE